MKLIPTGIENFKDLMDKIVLFKWASLSFG
jgi:hypothetical protein